MIEKEINGKKYGFHFNFYAWGMAEEEIGLPLDDILKVLGPDTDNKGNKIVKPSNSRLKIICSLIYIGAKNYHESKGIPIDFKVNDIGDWLEEIGFIESMKILESALKMMIPKNIAAPQTEGQPAKAGE